MPLPRSARRSTTTWAVNVATVAVLLSSVWWSAQQRPAPLRQFSVDPSAAESIKPSEGSVTTTTTRSPIGSGAAGTLTSATLDSEVLHRVAYAPASRR